MTQIQRPNGPMSAAGIQNFGLTASTIQIEPKIIIGAIVAFLVVVILFNIF
ncbi:Uncharacterised protein [uncultured archaeon]|nr:Uncharacterised protein [uncultured archaeon]